ncbi:MAG: SprT family zinc-dependent metalloprotease [Candidatus Moraniibacteriota bacterium]
MTKIEISKITYSKRRTVALIISAEATLIVRAPMRTPLSYIEKMVAQKADWISNKMQEISVRPKTIKKVFTEGEEFLYLGKKYQLKLTDKLEIKISADGDLFFPRVFLWRAKARLLDWYKKQALEEITQRVEALAQKLELKYLSIKISNAERNWGSCGPKNSLNFNWRLIMAPSSVIDYVIIHELMHILEKNHSHKFWSKVAGVMPEYKKTRKWLKDNCKLLTLE